jgi:CRP-like cAMP-binding protein
MGSLRGSGLINMQLENYETEQLPKKTLIYQEGKRSKYLYYLKTGKVKAYRLHEDGKDYITNLYTAGDFIGYLPLLEDGNYKDSASVLENAEIVLIPKEDFLSVVFRDERIAAKFIKIVAQNVQDKEDRLLSLAYSSLRKRVAGALIDIYSKFTKEGSSGQPLDISREDIAHYVGTATESLIRTLSDFNAEKLLEIKEGTIRIQDINKLKNLAY